jgi:GNAT superfamily N-acetyltransferase
MENGISFEKLKIEEINLFSIMVNNVFREFVGKDYSEEGNNTFMDYIEPKNILERFKNENNNFYVAKYYDEIIGAMEIKNKDHISLFFVIKKYHGKGIGKKLFGNYIKTLKQNNNEIKTITVNSSFYGEKIYAKLGFIKTEEAQEKNGIKYIPMEYKI